MDFFTLLFAKLLCGNTGTSDTTITESTIDENGIVTSDLSLDANGIVSGTMSIDNNGVVTI